MDMNEIEQYQNVILGVLTRNAGRSPEELLSLIRDRVAVAKEIAGDLGTPQNAQPLLVNSLRSGTLDVLRKPATESKIIHAAPAPPSHVLGLRSAVEEDVPQMEMSDIVAILSKHLPLSLEVKPTAMGGTSVILLRSLVSSPPEMGFVRLCYRAEGQEDGPTMTFSVRSSGIDVQGALRDIMTQADAMYTAQRRTVEPRAQPGMSMEEAGASMDYLPHDETVEASLIDPSVKIITDRGQWGRYAKE